MPPPQSPPLSAHPSNTRFRYIHPMFECPLPALDSMGVSRELAPKPPSRVQPLTVTLNSSVVHSLFCLVLIAVSRPGISICKPFWAHPLPTSAPLNKASAGLALSSKLRISLSCPSFDSSRALIYFAVSDFLVVSWPIRFPLGRVYHQGLSCFPLRSHFFLCR